MSVFDEVKKQVDIRQVVERYGFRINRAGQFTCPFHNDHKPSASIKKDYFNCFVCGAAGDAITFVAKYLGLSNLDAAKELVKEFNLNIDISTPEERRQQWIEERKQERERKAELQKCSSLRERFAKDKEQRAEKKRYTNYKLRNEIRESNIAAEEERQQYIAHCGDVLAEMHRYLWRGVHLYPFENIRHIRGAQELTVCEYYLECYDRNPQQFSINEKGVVEGYERRLSEWNNQDCTL